jgi:hypothetical protein
MRIDEKNPIYAEPNDGSSHPELLISAVLHLMSHYTAHSHETGACTKLASVIERHLKALAHLPHLAPVLQATCGQLAEQWAVVVDRTMPAPKKSHFLARMVSGKFV